MRRLLTGARASLRRRVLAACLCLLATVAVSGALGASACLAEGPHDDAPTPQSRASTGNTLGLGLYAYLEAPAGQQQPPPPPTPSEGITDFIWPSDGWIVQGMWPGHPAGIDIGASTGDPIVATRAGRVAFVGGDPCCEYGYFVILEHDNGWSSLYGHMSRFEVDLGADVRQGDVIGRIGATGKADGPHLHFELRSFGGVVDPLAYLWPRKVAPPPPPFVYDNEEAPEVASAPQPEPLPAPEVNVEAGQAIALALGFFATEAEFAYDIDPGSCTASRSGPNWTVNCRGTLEGCFGAANCSAVLTACVLDQPRLVTSVC